MSLDRTSSNLSYDPSARFLGNNVSPRKLRYSFFSMPARYRRPVSIWNLFEWISPSLSSGLMKALLGIFMFESVRYGAHTQLRVNQLLRYDESFSVFGMQVSRTGDGYPNTSFLKRSQGNAQNVQNGSGNTWEAKTVDRAVQNQVVEIVRKYELRSIIDYPCRGHREIIPDVLQMLLVSESTRLADSKGFRYSCVDSDSAALSSAHEAVRTRVGRRRGLFYKRQTHLTPKGVRGDLVFSWNIVSENDRNEIQEARYTLVSARHVGADYAILGMTPAEGTRWKMPPEWAQVVDSQRRFGMLKENDLPYFPLAEGLVMMKPFPNADGSTKFLLLYKLDALPRDVLVSPNADLKILSTREQIELDIENANQKLEGNEGGRNTTRRNTTQAVFR